MGDYEEAIRILRLPLAFDLLQGPLLLEWVISPDLKLELHLPGGIEIQKTKD